MSQRAALKVSGKESLEFCIVYWPGEDTATVLNSNDITEPKTLAVKAHCKVSVGKKIHTGLIELEPKRPWIIYWMSLLKAHWKFKVQKESLLLIS
jgi:hypothetical protein